MSESILLTDTDDAPVRDAVALLDGWRAESRACRELAERRSASPACARCCSPPSDPSALRASIELARRARRSRGRRLRRRRPRAGAPSSCGPRNGTSCPATAEEIAAAYAPRSRAGARLGSALADRVERVEYEQMLHDSLTGLPTLPVAIERSRPLIKERGELVVLYFNFVRYSKIEEIYGWEKLDAVLETTASAGARFPRRRRRSARRA